MTRRLAYLPVALAAAACAAARPAVAEEPAQGALSPVLLSGYERIRGFAGPDSVQSALRNSDALEDSLYRGHTIKDAIAQCYRFKERMEKRYGLACGFDVNMRVQGATAGVTDDQASGGVSRLYALWTVFGRGRPSFGKKNLRLTCWHQDPRKQAGTPEARGVSFSGAWRFEDLDSPFLRLGYAYGGVARSEVGVVAGVGYPMKSHDVLGLAIGWGARGRRIPASRRRSRCSTGCNSRSTSASRPISSSSSTRRRTPTRASSRFSACASSSPSDPAPADERPPRVDSCVR